MPSTLRSHVSWKEATVFAGEEIECIITIKNIARTAAERERDRTVGRHGSRLDGLRPIVEQQRNVTQSTTLSKTALGRLPSLASVTAVPHGRGHRPSLSLGVAPNTPPLGASDSTSPGQITPARARPSHGRSLSILSFHSEHASPSKTRGSGRPSPGGSRHLRSTSLQIVPRSPSRSWATSVSQRGPPPPNSAGLVQENGSPREGRWKPGANTAPNTPALAQGVEWGGLSAKSSTDFAFVRPKSKQIGDDRKPSVIVSHEHDHERSSQILSPVSPGDTRGLHLNTQNSGSRVLSEASVGGTSRTSSDIYSMSNGSDETVNSELPSQGSKILSRQVSLRKSRPDAPEHLMMGYVQCTGTFSLDGSLVNQAPFEEVKRKGIIGSQGGGGVVGVERSKRESGLFGAFGWTNIGESLTGLLGMDDMSSMREMNRVAETKSIPLLSTPQSILFVDLKLGPGESKSFSYRFKLPKGLPPSYKGRAIKIAYSLKLAVQRPGSSESKTIKDVDFPFRVLGSVGKNGEILGHDLMSPYIMLQDTSRSKAIPNEFDVKSILESDRSSKPNIPLSVGMDDFLRYTERLISEQTPGAPLMSPTETDNNRFSTGLPQPRTQKERIDLAVLRSNQSPLSPQDGPTQSSNRFTISRGGRHVGVLTMLRPAYRQGEAVLVNINFEPPPFSATRDVNDALAKADDLNTYLAHISLETHEKVDPALAVRSPSSINRVTRKVHASATSTTLFVQQAAFSLEIPISASPTFETTGVRLQWRVRVEFTTSVSDARRASKRLQPNDLGPNDEGNEVGSDPDEGEEDDMLQDAAEDVDGLAVAGKRRQGQRVSGEQSSGSDRTQTDPRVAKWLTADGLLENVSTDERGSILVAKESLSAESFEVNVPIIVYGVKGTEGAGGIVTSDVLEI